MAAIAPSAAATIANWTRRDASPAMNRPGILVFSQLRVSTALLRQQFAALHVRAIRQPDCKMLALALGPNNLDIVCFYAVVWLELLAPDPSQFTGINAVATEKAV